MRHGVTMQAKETRIICFSAWTPITTVYGVKIMQIIINKGMSPKDRAKLDNAQASAQRNADLIEYLAMMTDVEIPTDEEETEDE